MAQVTITVPDSAVPRCLAAFRGTWPDLAGQADLAAARIAMVRLLVNTVIGYEAAQIDRNLDAERAAAIAAAETALIGVQ